MGMHRIEIVMTGSHGCDRAAKAGDELKPCGDTAKCPDCAGAELVAKFKAQGYAIEDATIAHWPGTPSEVVDDLAAGKRRKGQFGS
jgi:hypothetical protein